MLFVEKPAMIMICGPNGAGKSTLTYAARKKDGMDIPYIDPDRIAKDLQCTPIEAGKIVSATIKKYINIKKTFIRESTLTGNFDFKMIAAAKNNGMDVCLVYIGVQSADTSVCRVSSRFAHGGHSVPEEDIRRRYQRSLENLPEAIAQVDSATVFDNSGNDYKTVAIFKYGKLISHNFTPKWFQEVFDNIQHMQFNGNVAQKDYSKLRGVAGQDSGWSRQDESGRGVSAEDHQTGVVSNGKPSYVTVSMAEATGKTINLGQLLTKSLRNKIKDDQHEREASQVVTPMVEPEKPYTPEPAHEKKQTVTVPLKKRDTGYSR